MSRLSPRSWLSPFVSPAMFDFWAARLRPEASWDRCLARVVSRSVEARDAVTLVLQPNRHFAGFRAGQHVNVGVEVDGVRHTRSYSPSDAPRADGRVSITVRNVDGGKVSSHLCLHTRVGDVLELGPAYGEMTAVDGPRLFCAAGSGVTPLVSLVRAAAEARTALDLDLVYWARGRADLCFADELREMAARTPGLRVHFVLTREPELETGEYAGRPSAGLLARLVPDHAKRTVSACGPAGFVDSLRALLDGRCVGFHAESFTPPAPIVPTDVTGTVRVELARSGRTLEVTAGTPLLAALETQGLKPAYGCRMGLCNTCACGKREGTTQNVLNGEFDGEPRSALRLCVNRAASDLILDL